MHVSGAENCEMLIYKSNNSSMTHNYYESETEIVYFYVLQDQLSFCGSVPYLWFTEKNVLRPPG